MAIIENQKAKKDMIFQKCMMKNSKIIMSHLDAYQENMNRSKKKPSKDMPKATLGRSSIKKSNSFSAKKS